MNEGIAQYCRVCWFPSTKPGLTFDETGLCRACRSEAERESVSAEAWAARATAFSGLVEQAVEVGAPHFDVVVPVSGGKDSITQVARSAIHGARVLAISVDYGVKTEIGRQNLDAVPSIGDRVHLQVYRPPLSIHKALMRVGLEQFGDPDLFSHALLHAYPLHQASALGVPLVVLGENSAAQYGGDPDIAKLPGMTREWFESFAVSGGHSVMSTASQFGFDTELLRYYDFPDAMATSATKTVFMSAYFRWDSETHLAIAQGFGFSTLGEAREGTFRTYVGIDEHINRIHQYLKLLKFGYGRATDHVCEEMRFGRVNRDEGFKLIMEHELRPPSAEAMHATAAFLGTSTSKLAATMERFRNPDIWRLSDRGVGFVIPGFLGLDESPPMVPLTSLFSG